MGRKILLYAVIGALLLVFGGAGFFGWLVYHVHTVLQPEAYAVWQTADLVIDHMEQHDGAWPRGWDDLQPPGPKPGIAYVGERGGATEIGFRPPGDVGRLQQLVDVDWSVDPRALARVPAGNGTPPFCVIWLKSGRHTAFDGCEPNQLIHDYLYGRYRVQSP